MDKKYLIAFDFDGTILPSVNTLSERTVAAVKAAKAAGHIIVATSARHWPMIEWVYDRMGLDTPISTINGAHVYHPKDDSFPVKEYKIGRGIVRILLELGAKYQCNPAYVEYRDRAWYTEGDHNKYYGQRIQLSKPGICFEWDNMPDTEASRVVLTPPDKKSLDAIVETVSKIEGIKANPWAAPSKKTACGEVYRVSIAPVGADKWDGVKHIADYYGIDAEDIYTFGDMWNDFGMIENAGHGYALKGSDADRQMKDKNVTRFSCAEDGVAEVIEREILKLHD